MNLPETRKAQVRFAENRGFPSMISNIVLRKKRMTDAVLCNTGGAKMQSVLSVRMDTETKESFARFCEDASLSVSTAIKQAHPAIEWRGIHSMRNILAHDYGRADKEIIWASVEYDFPELEAFCKAYAEDRGSSWRRAEFSP